VRRVLERGTPTATTGPMLRWWLALVLTVVSTTAWAQPASEPAVQADPRLAAATRRAQDAVAAGQRSVGQRLAHRDALHQRLSEQLVAIDRLKRGPRGWRTKAQLEERLAEANETQKQLEAADAQLDGATRQLAAARAGLAAAIDAELRGGVVGPLERALRAMRAELTPQRAARRIVLPDTKIDPRLDPEELDEQVAAIKQVEGELERQIKGLEDQAGELQRVHDLRQQHARTLELDQRDDNSSRRTAQTPAGGRGTGDALAPQSPSTTPSPPTGPTGPSSPTGPTGPTTTTDPGGAGAFESDAHIVLPEVVDPAVLDGIRAAQTSGDRAQRAVAVRKARDAVTLKLKDLRDKRAAIQGLARQRRQQR
jgi:TolA-binding protein